MPKNAHYVHLVSTSKEEDIFAMSQYSEFHEDNEHNDIVAINAHFLARTCLWILIAIMTEIVSDSMNACVSPCLS